MLFKSGYINVNAPFDLGVDETQTITGLNKALNKAYNTGKPIVLNNVLYEDDKLSPIYVGVARRALDGILIQYANYVITVNKQDQVTVEIISEVQDD